MQTPLYLAVSKLKYECAMKLLDAGANVHHADDARRTPICTRRCSTARAATPSSRCSTASSSSAPPSRRRPRAAHAAPLGVGEGRAAARHRADHGEGGRQRDGLGAARRSTGRARWTPTSAPAPSSPRRSRRPRTATSARPLHWAADKAALKCLTLLLGQTGISVRAPRPPPPLLPPPRLPRAACRPPSPAPRRSPPSLSPPPTPSPPFPGGRRRLGRLLGAALRGRAATRASASRLSSRRAPTAASSRTRTSSRSTWPPRPT